MPIIDIIDGKNSDTPIQASSNWKCTCGSELANEYGYCDHGLGSFKRCTKCLKVYDFFEDQS